MKEYYIFSFPQIRDKAEKTRLDDFDTHFAFEQFLRTKISTEKTPYIAFRNGSVVGINNYGLCEDKELVGMMTDYLLAQKEETNGCR